MPVDIERIQIDIDIADRLYHEAHATADRATRLDRYASADAFEARAAMRMWEHIKAVIAELRAGRQLAKEATAALDHVSRVSGVKLLHPASVWGPLDRALTAYESATKEKPSEPQ